MWVINLEKAFLTDFKKEEKSLTAGRGKRREIVLRLKALNTVYWRISDTLSGGGRTSTPYFVVTVTHAMIEGTIPTRRDSEGISLIFSTLVRRLSEVSRCLTIQSNV